MCGKTWDELRTLMPDTVRAALLPWEWSRERLWSLDLPVGVVAVADLRHLFDVPLWRGEDGTAFATRPADVLAAPTRYPSQLSRMMEADLSFPIDITRRGGDLIVLDGVHRLAKAALLGEGEILARVVPADAYASFALTSVERGSTEDRAEGR